MFGYAQGYNNRVAGLEWNRGAAQNRLPAIEDRISGVGRWLNMASTQ